MHIHPSFPAPSPNILEDQAERTDEKDMHYLTAGAQVFLEAQETTDKKDRQYPIAGAQISLEVRKGQTKRTDMELRCPSRPEKNKQKRTRQLRRRYP